MDVGMLFQHLGPATEKARSPKEVFDCRFWPVGVGLFRPTGVWRGAKGHLLLDLGYFKKIFIILIFLKLMGRMAMKLIKTTVQNLKYICNIDSLSSFFLFFQPR